MISDILANGESARLQRRLKEERQLFSEIDATVSGLVIRAFSVSGAWQGCGVSMEEGERAIFDELALQDACARGVKRRCKTKFAWRAMLF